MANVVMITGANRGIGAGLTKKYLAQPSTTVIAAVRDPSSPTSQALVSLEAGPGSKIILVKYDAASPTSAKDAIAQVTANNITHLDTVIANAGVGSWWGPVLEVPVSALQEHFTVNTVGSLLLYQAAWPLLEKSEDPKFVYISTTLGSIGGMEDYPFQSVAYGASKAAMNFIVKKIHLENEKITAFSIHPGWVQTDMGNGAGSTHGFGDAETTVEESVDGLAKEINNATRAKTSGGFLTFDGSRLPW